MTGWAKNWAKVVDRFANTISAQFYGHTHNDQFELWYDAETNSVPINVGYVTPSVTTFTGLNPSYRIYTVDGPYEGASMVSKNVNPYSMQYACLVNSRTRDFHQCELDFARKIPQFCKFIHLQQITDVRTYVMDLAKANRVR